MKRKIVLALSLLACPAAMYSAKAAETAPPSFQGDPDVYKVIFEDQYFRVIESTRKAGAHDKLHSHPLPSILYYVNDCTTRQYSADGKPSEPSVGKAGSVRAVPIVAAHSAENVTSSDCKSLFIERK